MHDVPRWFEITSLVVLAALLLVDLWLVRRRPHVPSVRECTAWIAFYVALALVFGGLLALVAGGDPATEFYAGWVTEYSLSVDNLFVFVLIMASFAVPRDQQQRVLMVGIIVALVLRGIFIAAGAAIIDRFVWVFYLFGAFLVYTAVSLVRGGEDEEYHENRLVRVARRVLPMTDRYDGGRLTTYVPVGSGATAGGSGATAGGVGAADAVAGPGMRRVLTPMLLVFVAIGTTDLLFAFDSIPAIFGLTRDPFIVFTTNVFALMGLRQLYFLLGGLLDRLVYLPYGLAVVLGFIGVKLVLEALHENTVPFVNGGQPVDVPVVPTWLSLVVIVVVLGTTTLASLWHARRQDRAEPPGDREAEDE